MAICIMKGKSLRYVLYNIYTAKKAETIHESIYGSDAKFYLHILQLKLKIMKPGMLSQELKKALGMPDGALPPWLTRMRVCIN